MANNVNTRGTIRCSDPYNIEIEYDITVPGKSGTAMDLWITTGATYTLDTLTIAYNGKTVTLKSTGEEAIITGHIYTGNNALYYQRGTDVMTVTGKKKDGLPVVFDGGSNTFRILWETPNTAPTADITSGEVLAGKSCMVSWQYRDAENDSVSLVSLIRYYKALGESSFTGTTLLTAGTQTSFTDNIPSGYGGGELYYEITYTDAYGAAGSSRTQTAYVEANTPPSVPGVPVISGRIAGGAYVTVEWTGSMDEDGNLEGYILQRSIDGQDAWETVYKGPERSVKITIPVGITTVSYRVSAYDAYGVQSAWAQTEELTVYNNQAPKTPAYITVPNTISTKGSVIISWEASEDPDGDAVSYILERSVGSDAFVKIYSGDMTSYTDTANGDWGTVAYRVCAEDSKGARSAYRVSGTKEVVQNFVPVLELVNPPAGNDFGVIDQPFSLTVTATDRDNNDTITVKAILENGVSLQKTSATPGEITHTFRYAENVWQKIPNGHHKLTITASDGTSVSDPLVVTFTKEVRDAVVTLDEPYTSSEPIEVCVIAVNGEIPDDAQMTVEVTNNAKDASPVWEDATEAATSGWNHGFTNKVQKNGWAFNFRVTLHGGNTRGYITSVQGGFQ